MALLNNAKTAMLLAAMLGLCAVIGHAMGGNQGLIIGGLFGMVSAFGSFFFSDKIAIAAMGGREITREQSPWLFQMIERLAERAGLPMPRVYVFPQAAPNAFATGRSPKKAVVAITAGMLENFPEREIEGVMAHEIAHVKHRDMLISTVAAVLAAAISQAAYMFMWFGGGGRSRDGDSGSPLGAIGLILMLVLAPMAAALLQMAISRSREFEADRYGAEISGDPLKLRDALARLSYANQRIPMDTNPAFESLYIVKPLTAGGLSSLFSTHPPTEARIARLEAMANAMR
jgi:heat shock protein HtpX